MEHPQRSSDERFERGLSALSEIDGAGGQKVIDSLADIAPDFARYLIEFPFGDIYSRLALIFAAGSWRRLRHLRPLAMPHPSSKST